MRVRADRPPIRVRTVPAPLRTAQVIRTAQLVRTAQLARTASVSESDPPSKVRLPHGADASCSPLELQTPGALVLLPGRPLQCRAWHGPARREPVRWEEPVEHRGGV